MISSRFSRAALALTAFCLAALVPSQAQNPTNHLSSTQPALVATLHPTLVWQRTSPPRGQMEGPVLYQLLFSASGTPGTLAKFDTNPRHLANSLIMDNGSSVTIGTGNTFALASNGVITFASGQTFPASGLPSFITGVTAGTGLIGGGTSGNVTLANTGVLSVGASGVLNSSGGQNPSITLFGVVPIANGGTGSIAQNFVDLTTAQTIGGNKTFTNTITGNGNLALPNTVSGGTAGVITLGGTPFVHNFGSQNTFVGAGAGNINASSFGSNTGVGFNALSVTTAGSNSAFGASALQGDTTGGSNAAFGASALQMNTTGIQNNAFGLFALQANTANNNDAFGALALFRNTTGSDNAAFGLGALLSNISGNDNDAFGNGALQGNTASGNDAFGFHALSGNTTGAGNSAFGNSALLSNTTACCNAAFGSGALSNTTGGNNSAFGSGALNANTTGGNNSAFGQAALGRLTSGDFNVAIGGLAGFNLASGSNNIYVGSGGPAGFSSENNTIRIGTVGTQTAAFIAGNVTLPGTLTMGGQVTFATGQTFPNATVTTNSTLTGTGASASPLGIANGGVGTAQLNASGSTIGQVLTSTGAAVNWQNLPAPPPLAWLLGGNAGTGCSTTPCAHFLGSTDNGPIEFRVNNQRAYRIEPATDTQLGFGFAPNMISGFSGNVVMGTGTGGATIAGGGAASNVNTVSGSFGAVGGGFHNSASSSDSTVAGGVNNTAVGFASTVAGGQSNTASGSDSTVAGGFSNTASGISSTVAGGSNNTASGTLSAVAGGQFNTASGRGSLAAGQNATAEANNCFVWADGTSNPGPTCGGVAARFVVEATGGTFFYSNSTFTAGVTLAAGGGSWSMISDRNVKANFAAVDGKDILARVIAMPVTTWNYQSQAASIRHIGPMAQDFFATFKVGEDDKHITTIDEGGVALAAIQGLNQKLGDEIKQKDARIAAQEKQIEALQQQMRQILTRIEAVEKVSATNEGVSRIAAAR